MKHRCHRHSPAAITSSIVIVVTSISIVSVIIDFIVMIIAHENSHFSFVLFVGMLDQRMYSHTTAGRLRQKAIACDESRHSCAVVNIRWQQEITNSGQAQ